jgi:hypothetical protein
MRMLAGAWGCYGRWIGIQKLPWTVEYNSGIFFISAMVISGVAFLDSEYR